MKRAKVTKLKMKKKQAKKVITRLESMMRKNMKMNPREKKRVSMVSLKGPKFARCRPTDNGVQRHPLLEAWNPYAAGKTLLWCIHEIQSRSGLVLMLRIASLKLTKPDRLGLHVG
jgi:hypothetical protein